MNTVIMITTLQTGNLDTKDNLSSAEIGSSELEPKQCDSKDHTLETPLYCPLGHTLLALAEKEICKDIFQSVWGIILYLP